MIKESEIQLKSLIGKKVSVLLDHHRAEGSDLKESYCGIVESVDNGVLILDTNNPKFFIEKLWLDVSIIISIWELASWYKPK